MYITSKIHALLFGKYLGTSLIIENIMIIRVTSVEWTWLGLECPLVKCVVEHPASLLSRFLLKNSLYFGVDKIIISFQKLVGD